MWRVFQRIIISKQRKQYEKSQICINVFLVNLFIIIKKKMKQNRLQLVHKNRLALFTKTTYDNQDKIPQIQNLQKERISTEIKTLSLVVKQKENKKINQKINLKIIDKLKEPLRLRSVSTSKINIKNEQFPPYQIFLSNESQETCLRQGIIQQQILQIIETLKKRMIIMQKQASNYIIKKDNLFKLLYYITAFQRCNSSNFDISELTDIKQNILIIFDKMKSQDRLKKQMKMSLRKNISNIRITQADYYRQSSKVNASIQMLLSDKLQIEESIKNLKFLKQQLLLQIKGMQNEVKQENQVSLKLKQQLSTGERQLAQLNSHILLSKDQLQKVDMKSNIILNYVNNQNNQLIKMASEEYKNIESQIYQYASYLQCNQLASSIEYQPMNILCITENLEDQIKTINRMLIQNDQISLKDKSKAMRDFLIQWMNKFKKKDIEMKQMMDFKTKCVNNFVQKMKKWLDNWTLKQQFLVNLRKQFSIDNDKMNQILQRTRKLPECQASIQMSKPVKEIYEIYHKIQNNYKLGNSFY